MLTRRRRPSGLPERVNRAPRSSSWVLAFRLRGEQTPHRQSDPAHGLAVRPKLEGAQTARPPRSTRHSESRNHFFSSRNSASMANPVSLARVVTSVRKYLYEYSV